MKIDKFINESVIKSEVEAELFKSKLKEGLLNLNIPHVHIIVSTLGGVNRPSILITISFDHMTTWINSILENSRYGKFHASHDGKLEFFSGYKFDKKFRKSKFKTPDDILKKIRKWISDNNIEITS